MEFGPATWWGIKVGEQWVWRQDDSWAREKPAMYGPDDEPRWPPNTGELRHTAGKRSLRRGWRGAEISRRSLLTKTMALLPMPDD